MLTLMRRAGEKIMIGDHISVTVVKISGAQVKLGIDAPREVRAYRGEIWDQIAEDAAKKLGDQTP